MMVVTTKQRPSLNILCMASGIFLFALVSTLPALAAECDKYEVWQLLLGIDKGWRFCVLASLLLLYNLCRALLTWKLGPLRDEEERSFYSPALDDYRWLYRVHRVVQFLLAVAVIALAYHGWVWGRTSVWLPA